MGIVSGNGYHYYNDDGFEIAHYMEACEQYEDSQHMLLVNEEVYLSNTSELRLQLFGLSKC